MAPPLHRRLITAILLLGMFTFAGLAHALDPGRQLYQYGHNAWRQRDGAPVEVRAITQTPDGFIWMAGRDGLYRFDGSRFELIKHLGGRAVHPGQVLSLAVDAKGRLLIGHTGRAGVARFDGVHYEDIEPSGHPPADVRFLAVAPSGVIWAVHGDRLWQIDGKTMTEMGEKQGLPSADVTLEMRMEHDGSIHVQTVRSDVMFIKEATSQVFHEGPAGAEAAAAFLAPNGVLWGTSLKGLIAVPRRAAQPELVVHVSRESTGSLLVDRDGGLWFQYPKGLQHVGRPDQLLEPGGAAMLGRDTISELQGLSSSVVYSMFEDHEGSIWVGTLKGVDRFRAQRFTSLATSALKESLVMAPTGDGGLLIASWGDHLQKIDGLGGERTYPDVGPGVVTLRRGANGAVFAGGNGLWHSADGAEFAPVARGTASGYITNMAVDAEGTLWTVQRPSYQPMRWRAGTWEAVPRPPNLPGSWNVASLLADIDGGVWIADGDALLRSGSSRSDAITMVGRLPKLGKVRSLAQRKGRLWIGGRDGLAARDGDRFVTVLDAQAKPIDRVVEVLEIDNGDLWVQQEVGALRIRSDQIQGRLSGDSVLVEVERFGAEDGLKGARAGNTGRPTLVQGSDGRLWFSTDEVLAWIDPYHVPPAGPPAVPYLRRLAIDGQEVDVMAPVDIRPGAQQIEIDYGTISPDRPEGINFRYRLKGFEEDWRNAGARDLALYTKLPPGPYTFEVSAAVRDGPWSSPAIQVLNVLPAWYQQLWFRIGCILLIALLAVLLHRMRLRQVTARLGQLMAVRQAERERIGRELHDSLLQTIYATILRVGLLARKLPVENAVRQGMEAEVDQLEQAVRETRRHVARVRDEESHVADLGDELGDYARSLCDARGIRLDIRITGTVGDLPSTVQHEVRSITKEALLNAGQHSLAKLISLTIDFGATQIIVGVHDDGVGMDDETRRVGLEGHWGLQGMRERAERIGGQLEVKSAPGQGTHIMLRLPRGKSRKRA